MDENGRTGVVFGHSYVTQTLDVLWNDGKITRGLQLEQVQFVRQQDEYAAGNGNSHGNDTTILAGSADSEVQGVEQGTGD
jgi:hypothetical protein